MGEHTQVGRNLWKCVEHNKYYADAKCPYCEFPAKRVYVRKVHDSIYERFHNYGMKFNADVQWDSIEARVIRLNKYVAYKRIDYDDAIVKVFRKSILITLRSCKEIKGMQVKDAEALSKSMINNVINQLPLQIKISDPKLVSVHNSFVNHPIAKHDVTVTVDGEKRLISDHSKGLFELEAVSPVHAVNDSVILERFHEDLLTKKSDLPSVLTYKTDVFFNAMEGFSLNMNRHVSVMENIDSKMGAFGVQIQRYNDLIDRMISLLDKKFVKKKRGPLGMTSPRCHR